MEAQRPHKAAQHDPRDAIAVARRMRRQTQEGLALALSAETGEEWTRERLKVERARQIVDPRYGHERLHVENLPTCFQVADHNPGRFGGFVASVTVGEWIGQVAKEAEVRNLTPHRLRHTSLSWAVDAGKPLRDVQAFARHSDPGMTAKYTRTTSTRLQSVVEALDYLG